MSKLFIIPTPVGNLEDISLRAIRILNEADLVLCEDTRVTGKLFKRYDIETRMLSFHQHNEHRLHETIVSRIAGGEVMAMVSDAGMPGISDPAFLLVRACVRYGVPVEALPGPTAFIPALVASGIPCDRFCFEGFLPVRKGRKTRLESLLGESRTMVFYESPHRLVKTLKELSDFLGPDRPACVSREISKLHETHHRGSLADLHAEFAANTVKGEITIVIAGKDG